MTFGSHTWIIALALVIPVLVLFFVLTEQRVWKRLSYFAGNRILRQLTANYSPLLRNTKATLVIIVVVLGCLALARPQSGHTYREEKTSRHRLYYSTGCLAQHACRGYQA